MFDTALRSDATLAQVQKDLWPKQVALPVSSAIRVLVYGKKGEVATSDQTGRAASQSQNPVLHGGPGDREQAIASEAKVEADGTQNTEQELGRLEQQTLVSSTVKSLAYNHDGVPTNVDSTGGPAEDGTGGWSAESGSSGATGSSGP